MQKLSQQHQPCLNPEALVVSWPQALSWFCPSTPGFIDNPTSMMISNAASIIIDANRSALALLKYSHKELIGKSTEDLWVNPVSYCGERITVGQGLPTQDIKAQFLDKYGNSHQVRVSFETFEWANQNYRLIMVHEITRSNRSKSRPRLAAGKLEECNQELAMMRSDLGHYAGKPDPCKNAHTTDLYQTKDKLEVILESISDVVIVVNSDGLVQQTNSALTTVLGYDHKRLIFQPFIGLPIFDDDAVAQAVQTVRCTGKPQRLEVQARHHDGHRLSVELNIDLVGTSSLGAHQVIYTLSDITARKKLEAGLDREYIDEYKLDEMNARFMAMLSHEFRTPLAVISTMVGTLLHFHDRLSAEKRVTNLRRIEEQGNRLLQITNDMLMLSRTNTADFTYIPVQLDLRAFCHTLIHEVKLAQGTERQINLEYKGNCDLVYLDENLLRHILVNLISNAIKYSFPGSVITVRIWCTQESVTVKVTDYGIGIPQQNQKNIFDAFQRAGNVGAIAGTGLGLTIVRHAVTAHRGNIEIESCEGQGTTFTVTLPNGVPVQNDKIDDKVLIG